MKSPRENDGLAGEAYVILRERILRGELSIGQVISRRKLATQLGMSLPPVSEAMLRLEHEGLLESRPRAESAFQLRRTCAATILFAKLLKYKQRSYSRRLPRPMNIPS